MKLLIPVLGLTHFIVFVLAGIFFHYENKKQYKEESLKNKELEKEIESLKTKIDNLIEVIVKLKKL